MGTTRIERIAVIGAGVMGSQIAAHFTNAGFTVDLYDLVPTQLNLEESKRGLSLSHSLVRSRIVKHGLEFAKKVKPPAFFRAEWAEKIRVGNLVDDLQRIAEADWIIEAITEDAEIKSALLSRIDQVRKSGSIVSSNTSGISINGLTAGRSNDFRRHWLGTHFFNPPRYLKLLEVIPTPETDPMVVETVRHIGENRLGKGIVVAKDTPNFIANRIGTFAIQHILKLMVDENLTIDEIDQLTGPLIGRPKSATFRTLDIVGLDTYVYVTQNIYQNAVEDEARELFKVPLFVEQMIERKWLGNKTKQGFYRKIGEDEILSLDVQQMMYAPRARNSFSSVEQIKSIENLADRLKALINEKGRVGDFLWSALSATLIYAANRVPEISDDVMSIDNAMKWGFNWELGPFEMWDALGIENVVRRIEIEGGQPPPLVKSLLSSSNRAFYQEQNGALTYFDPKSHTNLQVSYPNGIIYLRSLKNRNALLKKNGGASLIDLGDGIACVEFHSKMNSIGGDCLQMIEEGLRGLEDDFNGLVIGNQGQNFSAGANLLLILLEAQNENWEEIDLMIKSFQRVNMLIKYAPKPVVVAPFGLTLGGGCEIVLHAPQVQAAAETYLGLVELGVGLIPAGGGSKEMLLRCLKVPGNDPENDLFNKLRTTFETIASAKVSGSAHEAVDLGFLNEYCGISMNRDRLIQDAKIQVLNLARSGFRQTSPPNNIMALGNRGLASLKIGMHQLRRGGFISEYDFLLGSKLGYVLCGGDCGTIQKVSEQYLLDLEREVFLSLCGEKKTQERIQYMLKNGKALRN